MELLQSLVLLLVLLSVDAVHLRKGLSCVNDYVNNVSCTWVNSPLDPGEDCLITGVKRIRVGKNRIPALMNRTCEVQRYGNSPPGCSFLFENEIFTEYKNMPYISMKCNGTLLEKLTNYVPYRNIRMHPPGVPRINSTANETRISWSPGSPRSDFIKAFDFQVNITEENETGKFKEPIILFTQEQQTIIHSRKLKGFCRVRVRIKPATAVNSQWSNWSPEASWMVATGVTETPQNQDWLLNQTSPIMWGVVFSISLILVVILVLYSSCVINGLHQGKPVPNPSKYFHTLYSVHEGNLKVGSVEFPIMGKTSDLAVVQKTIIDTLHKEGKPQKKWLNPLSASESFFTAYPCDPISPVELCGSCDMALSTSPTSTNALLHFSSCPSTGSDTSGVAGSSSTSSSSGTSSWFSNRGYFMSSSSSSSRTHPSPAYFIYQDDVIHNLHRALCPSVAPSLTYVGLKREPQSPDSGFSIGGEEQEDREDKKFVEVEVEDDVSDHHHSSPLVILPLHLPPRMCPPSSPPPSPVNDPTAGSMCRSSSMPVEPCKTGYLTLKELHTTFSNKSI